MEMDMDMDSEMDMDMGVDTYLFKCTLLEEW